MKVTGRYFAAAAEAAGRDEEVIGFAPGATLGNLKHQLEGAWRFAVHRNEPIFAPHRGYEALDADLDLANRAQERCAKLGLPSH